MDIKVSRRESSKNTKTHTCSKNQHLEDIRLDDNNTTEEVFPWLSKFNKVVHSYAGSRNFQHLEELLLLYTQNILSSVAGGNIYKEFSNAVNLKNHINNMLIFFHLYWFDIKQDIADHSQYLNKISTLLNVYIDMELKISMEKKTSSHIRDSSKIAAKILAALYIYLNNSEEHIFRVLLRIEHTTEKYTKVCNHIFTKSFTNLKTKTTSITDVAYIRYLLAFKMWRKMEETTKTNLILSDKTERINKLAVMLLGPRMPKLQDELLKFVPRPPIGQENETLWLIQSNLFDLKEVHKHFLLFEDKMNNSTDLQCTKIFHADQNCSKSQKHQMNLFCQSNSDENISEQEISKCSGGLRNNDMLSNSKNKSLDQTYLQKKGTRSLKPLKKIRKNPGKPIIIDLTGDDEISLSCEIKRKKTKRNSKFLRVMKYIMRSKKHINSSNVLKENKLENCVSLYMTIENANSYNNSITQNKEALTSQEENTMETIPLKTCQNNITDQHFFKQELPTSTNCSAMQKPHKHCNTMSVCGYDDIIKKLKSINDHSSQITEIIKQEVYHQVNECPNCRTKIDRKPFMFTNNDITAAKTQGTLHNTFNDNENDIKLACVYVVNHIDEHVMTLHAEKREQHLDKSNDSYTVSTTFTEDQIVNNVRMNDYDNAATYSEVKEQKRSDCDSSILNDRLCSLESSTVDINSFDIGSNAEVDYDLKNFPKIEEANEITKTDCVDDFEHVFSNKSETPYNPNIIYMLSDKCIYITNHTGEHIMTTNAEKRMQCLHDSNMCTVSTTFIGDQNVESLDSQHVDSDRRKCGYENDSKYSEDMIKEELSKFDFFEIDSKEASEITDSTNDFEINFLHNIQNETLEDILSVIE